MSKVPATPPPLTPEMRSLMFEIDGNGDGTLTRKELDKAKPATHDPQTVKDLKAIVGGDRKGVAYFDGFSYSDSSGDHPSGVAFKDLPLWRRAEIMNSKRASRDGGPVQPGPLTPAEGYNAVQEQMRLPLTLASDWRDARYEPSGAGGGARLDVSLATFDGSVGDVSVSMTPDFHPIVSQQGLKRRPDYPQLSQKAGVSSPEKPSFEDSLRVQREAYVEDHFGDKAVPHSDAELASLPNKRAELLQAFEKKGLIPIGESAVYRGPHQPFHLKVYDQNDGRIKMMLVNLQSPQTASGETQLTTPTGDVQSYLQALENPRFVK